MDAFEAIEQRRSVRTFKPEAVPQEVIENVIDAGRQAPTARNVQPWEFVVSTDQTTRSFLGQTCDHGGFIKDSPVCIITFCRDTKYYLEDGCAAIENMLIAATAHGLGTCWVAGDKKDYAPVVAERLGVPANYYLVGLIAMGYSAEAGSPKEKRPLNEVLHMEKW
jgi:nitroreductase